MAEKDALSEAKFNSGLFLTDFPARIRVLTRDPMVYNDNFANTKYAFIVFNLDSDTVQVLDKTGGFAKRFQEINNDEDFGGDLRKIDVKITTNGKQGKDIRYTITPIGNPGDLSESQKKTIVEAEINLETVVKKNNPGAVRLSEVNAGTKPGPANADISTEPTPGAGDDVVIEDIGDEPINLDDIPF